MELALLVWVISILKPINLLLVVLAVMGIFTLAINWMCWVDPHSTPFMGSKWTWFVAAVTLFLATVSAVIPNTKTAYIMVGAYATQRIAEDPKVQQISGKVVTLIEQRLDEYIKESEKVVKEATK